MVRILPENFLKAFHKAGPLYPVLDAVHHDNTLDFQIRHKEVHVYYRGGKILGIKSNGEATHFQFSFDLKYSGQEAGLELPKDNAQAKEWVEKFPLLKQAMDRYFTKYEKYEREFQQLIVRENTYSKSSNGTDFFIIDIEYEQTVKVEINKRTTTRFDLIGLHWPAEAAVRRSANTYRPRLCLFELKYGDSALGGKSGMVDHLEKALQFCKAQALEELKDEMVNLFSQKRKLQLVHFAKTGAPGEIVGLDARPMFIFLLANHNPRSTVLGRVLDSLEFKNAHAELSKHMDIRFGGASFLGYGLYEEHHMLTLEKFRSLLVA